MNKSEIELANIQAIIDEMPVEERNLCERMNQSLLMSVGHPLTGRMFMLAIALTNCQIAVTNIKLGLVNADGSIPDTYPATKAEEDKALDKAASELLKFVVDESAKRGD